MRIRVIAVGKLKERFWRDACAEYIKRIGRYCQISVVELDDRDPAKCGGEAKAREQEAADISRHLPSKGPGRRLLCLDPAGKLVSSEDLASSVEGLTLGRADEIVFVIGGPTGLDGALERESDEVISLGRITMPHNLARVVLLEQVYRAFKIIRGEPYHR